MNGIPTNRTLGFAQNASLPTGIEKKCTRCNAVKPLSEFYKAKRYSGGHNARCKKCRSEINYEYNKKTGYMGNYYTINKQVIIDRAKIWASKNPEKTSLSKKCSRLKLMETVKGRLDARMSRWISKALAGSKNGQSWEAVAGYSIDDLMVHLESLFTPGMSWGNRREWHIDHITPKSAFIYHSPEDDAFKRCWSLKNLQPLWAIENMKKHAKLPL